MRSQKKERRLKNRRVMDSGMEYFDTDQYKGWKSGRLEDWKVEGSG